MNDYFNNIFQYFRVIGTTLFLIGDDKFIDPNLFTCWHAKRSIAFEFRFDTSLSTVWREDGWVRYGNSRYLIINIPTLKWSDARRTCQMLGGDLAIIRSAAENTFIFNLVKKQKTFTAWGAWLGFVRKADKKFYWIDDTPLSRGYTAWARGEPGDVSEKCGNMFGAESRAGKWNDIHCDKNPKYLKFAPVILCQKKAN